MYAIGEGAGRQTQSGGIFSPKVWSAAGGIGGVGGIGSGSGLWAGEHTHGGDVVSIVVSSVY